MKKHHACLFLRCLAAYQPPAQLRYRRLLPLPAFTWLITPLSAN